jgi:hypothetical protein
MQYDASEISGWDHVPALERKATPFEIKMIGDALARDYACRAAYGKSLLDGGLSATLKGIYFDTHPCPSATTTVFEAKECYACKFQDTMAGVQPDMAEEHAQADYEAKIAERMGR